MIRADEILDPRHHGRSAEPVTGGAIGVVLDVEHAGEGDAVVAPTAAVLEEEVGLRAAGAVVWMREVVAASDEVGSGSAFIV